jgi:hypothetical protein
LDSPINNVGYSVPRTILEKFLERFSLPGSYYSAQKLLELKGYWKSENSGAVGFTHEDDLKTGWERLRGFRELQESLGRKVEFVNSYEGPLLVAEYFVPATREDLEYASNFVNDPANHPESLTIKWHRTVPFESVDFTRTSYTSTYGPEPENN